jgi:WD40 repeat protein
MSTKPRAIALTSDDHYVISALPDGTLTKQNVKPPNQIKIFAGHLENIQNIIITSDDQYVISSTYDGVITLWNLRTGDLVLTRSDYKEHITCMAITQNNQYLITASQEGTVIVWQLENGRPVVKAVLDGIITSIEVTKDGNKNLVGDGGGNLYCLSCVKCVTK